MNSRKLFLILLAVVFVIGAVGSAYALDGNVIMAQYSCTGCHGVSTIKGTNNASTVTKIMNSIAPGGLMASISSVNKLTLAEAQAIADVLFPPMSAACTGYTYSAWSACGANGQQTRTVTGNTPTGCTGTPSTPAVLTRACTPAPVACAGYTYSAWSVCGSNGQQTRTVISNSPAGCTGTPSTPAVLTRACTPAPVACTGYTYSAWSVCGSNGQQTRTVISKTPAGCTGAPSTAAKLTRACTSTPVACTGYTYSAWSVCGSNGQQTRTVINKTPAGCTGAPSTAAKLTRACTPTTPSIDGTTLYMQRCSACHGSIERSQVRGATDAEIKDAITNVGEMKFLKFLPDAKIQAIADALVTTTPPPPPPPPTGGPHPDGWLSKHPDYVDRNGTSSCTACHGQDLKGGIGPSCFSCHSDGGKDD